MATMTDQAWRTAYRIGFRTIRLWWWLRHPDQHGAVVAVWFGGRILVLRQSYRANPFWPGGGMRPGEDPREAARRELAEEIGLAVRAEDLVPAGEMVAEWDYRRDHVRIFELWLETEPAIRIDGREIIGAEFVDPQALLAEDGLPPFIRAYLGERRPHAELPPAET